jgi:hypothetical protein
MREKKQFFIPKNYDKKFEFIPNISGWQHMAFIPVIAADFYIIGYSSFDFSNRLVISAVLAGLPWTLIGTHPVRDNVSLYKHLYWKLKFMIRQRRYKYKKEGYANVQLNEVIEASSEERKARTTVKGAVSARLNPVKGHPRRDSDNTGQQNGPVHKSVGH